MSQLPASRLASDSSEASADDRAPSVWNGLVEVTKPGITRLVTITSTVAFLSAILVAGIPLSEAWLAAIGCVLGTAISAAGANALNMWYERDLDARMARTAGRPIPAGLLSSRTVLLFGTALALAGPAVLWICSGIIPAVISLATTASYVLVYTPSKQWTPLSTVIGGVPGALPVLIGWTAGSGSLTDPAGWSLFMILFVWQVPHFLAIAWRYAEDYAKAGHRVLPAIDAEGRTTSLVMLVWTLCLLPATLTPIVAMPSVAGPIYAGVATLTGVLFIAASIRLIRLRTDAAARAVFFASIIHLPLLLVSLLAEGLLRQLPTIL